MSCFFVPTFCDFAPKLSRRWVTTKANPRRPDDVLAFAPSGWIVTLFAKQPTATRVAAEYPAIFNLQPLANLRTLLKLKPCSSVSAFWRAIENIWHDFKSNICLLTLRQLRQGYSFFALR
jgi:hypothetical protein